MNEFAVVVTLLYALIVSAKPNKVNATKQSNIVKTSLPGLVLSPLTPILKLSFHLSLDFISLRSFLLYCTFVWSSGVVALNCSVAPVSVILDTSLNFLLLLSPVDMIISLLLLLKNLLTIAVSLSVNVCPFFM